MVWISCSSIIDGPHGIYFWINLTYHHVLTTFSELNSEFQITVEQRTKDQLGELESWWLCRIAKRFPVFAEIDGKEQKDRISIGLVMTQYIVRSEIAIHTLVDWGSDNLTLILPLYDIPLKWSLSAIYFLFTFFCFFSAFRLFFVCFLIASWLLFVCIWE